MSNAVQKIPEAQLVAAPTGTDANVLMRIIEKATLDPNFDVAKLERLLVVRDQWAATEARNAFNVSFAAFKAEAVVIVKNKGVTDGPLKGKRYAELHSVVNAVTPLLSRHGLSHSWKLTKDEKDWIEVTCSLKHVLGHVETVSMAGPPDSGGAKNAIQSRASTITYLERYTLKAVCGLAEQEDDNDGNGSGEKRLDEGAAADHIAAIDAADTEDALKKAFGSAWKAAESAGDKGAMRLFTQHKDARKAALGKKS